MSKYCNISSNRLIDIEPLKLDDDIRLMELATEEIAILAYCYIKRTLMKLATLAYIFYNFARLIDRSSPKENFVIN